MDLTGETEDKNFILKLGDSRVSVTMTRDEHTVKLGRTNRFLIDDTDSPAVLAYRLTKPFKLGYTYNNKGVFSFVLQECETEESDNLELHIANYYDWFPRESDDEDDEDTDTDEDSEDESTEDETTEEDSTESAGRRVVI